MAESNGNGLVKSLRLNKFTDEVSDKVAKKLVTEIKVQDLKSCLDNISENLKLIADAQKKVVIEQESQSVTLKSIQGAVEGKMIPVRLVGVILAFLLIVVSGLYGFKVGADKAVQVLTGGE